MTSITTIKNSSQTLLPHYPSPDLMTPLPYSRQLTKHTLTAFRQLET